MSDQSARLPDIASIKDSSREDIQDGAVTSNYQADLGAVINLLNGALATELVCVLRYRAHYFMATGLSARNAAEEFMEHAQEELGHADALAARIVQLGGEPNFSPEGLIDRSHAEFVATDSLTEMIEENLIAERIAIDSYRQMIEVVDNQDPTTRRVLEEILAKEEEHADDLAGLLEQAGK